MTPTPLASNPTCNVLRYILPPFPKEESRQFVT